MFRLSSSARGALGAAAVSLMLVPAAAGAETQTLTIADAEPRSCTTPVPDGTAGVDRRETTSTADGLVQARLTGGEGDWDVAVFSGDRLVAGSSHFGTQELAEGVVMEGQELVVQTCRRSGDTESASLDVSFIPLAEPTGEPIKLVRIDVANDAEEQLLDTLGLDLTEDARPGQRDALLFGAEDEQTLEESGLDFEVVTPDLVAADRAALEASAGPEDGLSVPSGRTEYRRLPDYAEDMKRLVEENPDLVKPVTLPNPSLEGRPVEGIEITPDVDAKDGKPVFLQMAVHHAREWPSSEHVMEWAFDLVEGYNAGDERTVELLSKTRAIVVPIVNPDGFNLSRESKVDVPVGPAGLLAESFLSTDFAYKRRNCRIQDGAIPAEGQCAQPENRFLGVDPNRNYGSFWGGGGASADPESDTYRGAGPFSEPETRNVKEFVSSRQVTTLITNHTYGDLVLRPPGLAAQGPPPDEEIYKALGDAMAEENGYTSQKSYELYDTTGTTEDWSYFATGGLGFTFEIGKAADGPTGFESLVGVGFHPPYPLGVMAEYNGKYPTGGGNREAYFKALEHTADASKHAVVTGRAQPGTVLKVEKEFEMETSPVLDAEGEPGAVQTFANRLTSELEVPASGTFEWHMNPSTRPGLDEDRTTSEVADEPTQTIDIGSATPVVSKQVPFTVSEDDARRIKASIDGADGEDYDLYLYKGSFGPQNEVASSASETADEAIVYENAEPGDYVLEIRFFTATSGFTGSLETYGSGEETTIPGTKESWTLTCVTPGGAERDAGTIEVDRGETLDLGEVCATAARDRGDEGKERSEDASGGQSGATDAPSPAAPAAPAAPQQGSAPSQGRLSRLSAAVDRMRLATVRARGLRVRTRCNVACRLTATATVSRATARRLGLRSATVGRTTVRLDRAGRKVFRLPLGRTARARLARTRSVGLTVTLVGTARDGARRTTRKALTLTR